MPLSLRRSFCFLERARKGKLSRLFCKSCSAQIMDQSWFIGGILLWLLWEDCGVLMPKRGSHFCSWGIASITHIMMGYGNMSTPDDKLRLSSYFSQAKIAMIPMPYISRLNWSADLGQRLKHLRGGVSRRELAQKVKSLGEECSQQYIHRLEDGQTDSKSLPLPESISLSMLLAICQALEIDLGQIIPMMTVDLPDQKILVTQG